MTERRFPYGTLRVKLSDVIARVIEAALSHNISIYVMVFQFSFFITEKNSFYVARLFWASDNRLTNVVSISRRCSITKLSPRGASHRGD